MRPLPVTSCVTLVNCDLFGPQLFHQESEGFEPNKLEHLLREPSLSNPAPPEDTGRSPVPTVTPHPGTPRSARALGSWKHTQDDCVSTLLEWPSTAFILFARGGGLLLKYRARIISRWRPEQALS